MFDIFSLAWSIYDVIQDPKDWKNWAWLAADVAFLIIPFIPSIMAKTNKFSDTVFTVRKFDDVYDSIVIGNNMERATNMAMNTGPLVYRGFGALNALDNTADANKDLKAAGKIDNARWLMDKFYKGYKIIDVGRDSRTFLQFWKSAHGMERRLLFFLRYGKAISIGGRVITRGIRGIW